MTRKGADRLRHNTELELAGVPGARAHELPSVGVPEKEELGLSGDRRVARNSIPIRYAARDPSREAE